MLLDENCTGVCKFVMYKYTKLLNVLLNLNLLIFFLPAIF